MFKKIITHAGTFHADEVSACALLQILNERTFGESLKIERTYTPSPEDLSDPQVIVLDIGREFNLADARFDHHQDAELPASNVLVLEHVAPVYAMDEEEVAFVKAALFSYISDVDTGTIVEGKDTPPTINSIIRMCNNLQGDSAFECALIVARIAINAAIETARRRVAARNAWNQFARIGDVRVNDTKVHPVGWHEFAEAEGVRFLVSPNPRVEGQYQVTSRDSAKWKIPAHPDQVFLHNSGFIASYTSRQAAIDHATSL